MIDNYNEHILTYALDLSGKMVYIGCVKRGLSCNCRCPKCNEYLEAKLGYGGRQPHFAHGRDSNCHGSYMTALHKLAEQIIEEEKAVMTPGYKEINGYKLLFEKVEIERRVDSNDLQPDIVGVCSDGTRFHIEIFNTNRINETKKEKIFKKGYNCLEIDVRGRELAELKSFLLDSTENREWINYPYYDAVIVNQKHKKIEKVIDFLYGNPQINLPSCPNSNCGRKRVNLKKVSIIQNDIDGLYSTVNVLSSDNQLYLFFIGESRALEGISRLKPNSVCDEFYIHTDDISLDKNLLIDDLDIQWCYKNHKGGMLDSEKQSQDNRQIYKGKRTIEECYREFQSTKLFVLECGEQENIFLMNKTRRSLILLIGSTFFYSPYKIVRMFEEEGVVCYEVLDSLSNDHIAQKSFRHLFDVVKQREDDELLSSLTWRKRSV